MERSIINKLLAWKANQERKPLILKGARQVGKTFALTQFGMQHYQNTHIVNFEKQPQLASLFNEDLDPERIIRELGVYLHQDINTQHDLLIFDEIQACPPALTSLKYFCEDLPEQHICAAGSLLGVHLGEASYPVGKVNTLEMYPLSFSEFLLALGERPLHECLQSVSSTQKISTFIHEKLWKHLKQYFITGGLPEVVKIFCDNRDQLVGAYQKVREKQRQLIDDYHSDMAKHAGKINAMHIERAWRSVPEQLARSQDGSAKKFRFGDVMPGIKRYTQLAGPIDWLDAAGLLLKTKIANQGVLPFSAYTKENVFKLYLFDVGILGALSELAPKSIFDYDYGTYKGYFAENFVAQEFRCAGTGELYSWQEGSAEVEFLRQTDGQVLPCEVKSGWVTQAKSIKVFAQKYAPPYRIILSAKPMVIDNKNHIQHLPLYMAAHIPVD